MTASSGPVPQPGILGISPYVGGEFKAPGVARPARLASNESPLGPSPHAAEAYRALADEIHRYPDGHAVALRDALGRRHGIDPARIVCGQGSDELFALLAHAYAGPGDEVLHTEYGFLAYPLVALAAGATPVSAPERGLRADVDALLARANPRTRIVFLANPNNPTGSYLATAEIERLIAALPPQVLIVLDAAYAEFVDRPDYTAGHEFVERHPNLVVTRTFSKIYGLAGLRLGWAHCPAPVADVLNRIRQPFNVSAPAQAAGIAALDDTEFLAAAKAHNDYWLPWLTERLAALGVTVHPSVGNFVLASFSPYDGEQVRLFLKLRGVLVRQMGAYKLPDCLRIGIGTADEMEALVEGVRAFLDQAEQ
jgi:histidinol-phosphate aminotransferase